MVKPDGVHQNLTGAVLEFLAARDFRPLSATTVVLTPQRRSELYATTRGGGRLDWDLNAVLYTLGPVTAVLLRGPGGAAHVSADLKGHFVPTRARPGSLRGDLNSLNPIFNLVHASDSEPDVIREVLVLFGRTLNGVLAEPGEIPSLSTAPLPIDHWRAVGDVVARLLLPYAPERGWERLREVGWPAAGMSRRAAVESVRRVRGRLLEDGRWSVVSSTAGLPALIAGTEQNLPGVSHFCAATAALPQPPARWHSYLTYTSLRYLDLCLDVD
jgi:nucleoside diphosphate kinase